MDGLSWLKSDRATWAFLKKNLLVIPHEDQNCDRFLCETRRSPGAAWKNSGADWGERDLAGGNLTAAEGRIELGSVAGQGTVQLNSNNWAIDYAQTRGNQTGSPVRFGTIRLSGSIC